MVAAILHADAGVEARTLFCSESHPRSRKTFLTIRDYRLGCQDAKLSLSGYADNRGPNEYNQLLSERRAQRVREFLISKGIPENKIETAAYGEEKPISKATVIEPQANNPTQPSETFVRNFTATWLAHNRRVDVMLIPTNLESLRFYPNQAPDSEILWQKAKPSKTVIEQNQ